LTRNIQYSTDVEDVVTSDLVGAFVGFDIEEEETRSCGCVVVKTGDDAVDNVRFCVRPDQARNWLVKG
jgi:hypothetical protein